MPILYAFCFIKTQNMNIAACSVTVVYEFSASQLRKHYAWSNWRIIVMAIILCIYDSFNCEMARVVYFHPAHLWPFKMFRDPQRENCLLIYPDSEWLINLLWCTYNESPEWHTLDAMATQLGQEEMTGL